MSNVALVSIIMPLYNSEKFIAEAIESVIAQTYLNWELIVVDDKSTDGSSNIVEKYLAQDSRIILISLKKNGGATKARNIGIKEAKGKYIAFLDSDDIWLPDKLKIQMSFLITNHLVLTYSDYETMDENARYVNTRYSLPSITYDDMLKSNWIGNLTGIYDVDYFGKVYLDNLGHEDYVLWLKLLKQIQGTKGINKVLARYRIHKNSLSSSKLKVLKWQWSIYRNIEKLTMTQSIYYFLFYIYYAIRKRN